MVLTNERRLGSDIWSKILDEAESIENIMRIVWTEKTHYQQKVS